MDKETRLRYGETVMTHAMVFTAYVSEPLFTRSTYVYRF